MKKRVSIALAAMMIMMMGMQVNAANSISTTTTVSTSNTTTTTTNQGAVLGEKRDSQVVMDGKTVSNAINISTATSDLATEAEKQAQSQITSNATVMDCIDVVSKTSEYKSITIPFSIKGVKAGDDIMILHKKADNTWEAIKPDKIEDGVVTATFSSLGTVAFIDASGANASGSGAAAVLGASRSPKTYDWFPAISAVALASILGIVYCKKRLDAEEEAVLK